MESGIPSLAYLAAYALRHRGHYRHALGDLPASSRA